MVSWDGCSPDDTLEFRKIIPLEGELKEDNIKSLGPEPQPKHLANVSDLGIVLLEDADVQERGIGRSCEKSEEDVWKNVVSWFEQRRKGHDSSCAEHVCIVHDRRGSSTSVVVVFAGNNV